MIDRDALRECLPQGPVAVIQQAKRLGYVRGRYPNGFEVIATRDGKDTLHAPTFAMREARAFTKAWDSLPLMNL